MNRSILSFMLVAGAASSASAQPVPAAESPSEQAYQRGRKHYDLQEWDQAIAEFKEAYRLRNDAASLFNIAQSYRLKGDCAQAAAFYKTYRRNYPNAENIARVEQFILDMEDCAKRAAATDEGTPTDTAPPDPTGDPTSDTVAAGASGTTTATTTLGEAPTPPRPERGAARPSLGNIGIGVAGAGVASIVGGVVFALRARSIEEDVMQLPRWDPDLHDSGQRADLVAKLLFGLGGAAVISGGVLMYLGYRTVEREPSTALRVVPHADGASVSWSTRF